MGLKLRPVSMNSRTQQKQRARGLLSSFRAGTFERLFERPARVNAGEVGTVLGGGVKVGIGFDALGGLCGRFFNPLSAWRLPQQRLFHPAGAVGLGTDARQSDAHLINRPLCPEHHPDGHSDDCKARGRLLEALISPSSDRTAAGQSAAGSAWARLPPKVPLFRTWTSPISLAVSGSSGHFFFSTSEDSSSK